MYLRIVEQEFVIGRGRHASERKIYSCANDLHWLPLSLMKP